MQEIKSGKEGIPERGGGSGGVTDTQSGNASPPGEGSHCHKDSGEQREFGGIMSAMEIGSEEAQM